MFFTLCGGLNNEFFTKNKLTNLSKLFLSDLQPLFGVGIHFRKNILAVSCFSNYPKVTYLGAKGANNSDF